VKSSPLGPALKGCLVPRAIPPKSPGSSSPSWRTPTLPYASRRLLANTDLDASEIAFLLGFEELNSFSRAFHGWEGATPSRWREARQRMG